MAKKYYGVRQGHHIGIFDNWTDCQKSIKGYSGAEYKGFMTREEAIAYVTGDQAKFNHPVPVHSEKENMLTTDNDYAFVDGSFNSETGIYGYGGFLITNGEKYVLQGAGNDPEMASMHNVSGEILGSMAAVEKALSLNLEQLTIYYDYSGIEKWATGEWKRNKKGTIAYHDFMQSKMKNIHLTFVKVKGHTGIPGNEEADRLAKAAVNQLQSVSYKN